MSQLADRIRGEVVLRRGDLKRLFSGRRLARVKCPVRRLRLTVWTVVKQALLATYGLFIRVRVIGRIAVPIKQGCIIAVNHLNGADAFVVQVALRTRLFFAASAKWFRSRLSRFVMTNICDAVPVATGDPIASLPGLKSCIATLRGGGSIGIFPEGQFNLSGEVGALQDGTAYLSARSGKPIVPVIIRNMRLGVKVDESNRRVECWTGFLSTVENLLNTDFQVLIGDPVLPDAEGVGDPEGLRQQVARINRELRQRFDELAELHVAA